MESVQRVLCSKSSNGIDSTHFTLLFYVLFQTLIVK